MTDALAKAAPALRQALAAAVGSDPIGAVLELAAPEARPEDVPLGGTPEATATGRMAREEAAEALARHAGATLAALETLGLAPRGGRYLPFVAARGSADAIRAALALPGVVSATLESPTASTTPHRAD